jgi:C4-type Zn-finger protein
MNKEIMKAMGFDEELDRIATGKCPLCGESINLSMFRDEISRKEFAISGMCQKCQDRTFVEQPEPCEVCGRKDTDYCKNECPI